MSPDSRATLADIHVEAVHASNVRPLGQDASWVAYVSVQAPTLKEV
jgi:hypothetical protein